MGGGGGGGSMPCKKSLVVCSVVIPDVQENYCVYYDDTGSVWVVRWVVVVGWDGGGGLYRAGNHGRINHKNYVKSLLTV